MKLVVAFNSSSGRVAGPGFAHLLEEELGEAGDGHEVELFEVGPNAARRDLVGALEGRSDTTENGGSRTPADGLIVAGGDGTVHSCAMAASRTNTPLYHFPTGTENLFAREFGMDRDLATVRSAIENLMHHELAGRPMPRIDLGRCNGRSFLLMVSVGVDANIVHRLCRTRSGRITHLSYVPHIMAELLDPQSRPMTISVDGATVVERSKGMVVIANSRQYALRMDPARRASMTDGKLDVVFFPAEHWYELGVWMLRSRFGNHLASDKLVYRTGKHIQIEAHGGEMFYQLDGEATLDACATGEGRSHTTPMKVEIQADMVPVMVPQRIALPEHGGTLAVEPVSPALA